MTELCKQDFRKQLQDWLQLSDDLQLFLLELSLSNIPKWIVMMYNILDAPSTKKIKRSINLLCEIRLIHIHIRKRLQSWRPLCWDNMLNALLLLDTFSLQSKIINDKAAKCISRTATRNPKPLIAHNAELNISPNELINELF